MENFREKNNSAFRASVVSKSNFSRAEKQKYVRQNLTDIS
jgi:hypothetical protein